MKVLIIGGIAGGASAATRLRRLNEEAEIVLFEKGGNVSAATCGLPYYIGGKISNKKSLTVQTPESLKQRFNINVRVKSEVININRQEKNVSVKNLESGEIYIENYDKLIISTGAKPIVPKIDGISNGRVFTIRSIEDTLLLKDYIEKNVPAKAAIIGGGYIGIEMAENLYQLGIKTTIIEQSKQIIGPLDYDMVADVQKYITDKGLDILLNNGVKEIKDTGNELEIILNNGSIQVDFVICAIGVRPDTNLAKSAGIDTNELGQILINQNMLTSDENIYAVGDAVEVIDFGTNQKTFVPLAGPASKQGRIAADNICGIKSRYTGTMGSSILKIFDMNIGMTGINEKTAQKLNLNYEKVFVYAQNHATYYPDSQGMQIKTIFEKETGKILGVQIVGGEGVDKRVDVLATVIRLGGTAYDLTRLELCYAPPFSSAKDPVNIVGFAIENILTGKSKVFHWNEIDELSKRDDIIWLDTRTKMEYEFGHIDGFINIPVDELRDRLNELDKNKKIYLTCATGLRAYIATRILDQSGYDSYNLSGGYRLYSSIVD